MKKLIAFVKDLFARPSAYSASAKGIYHEPTFSQVERLIAAAKGEEYSPPEKQPLHSKPTYAQFERLIEALQGSSGDGQGHASGCGYALDLDGRQVTGSDPAVCSLLGDIINRVVLDNGESIPVLEAVLPEVQDGSARAVVVRFELGDGVSVSSLRFRLPDGEQNSLVLEPATLPPLAAGKATAFKLIEFLPGSFMVHTLLAPEDEGPKFTPSPDLDGSVEMDGETDSEGYAEVEGETNESGVLEVEVVA